VVPIRGHRITQEKNERLVAAYFKEKRRKIERLVAACFKEKKLSAAHTLFFKTTYTRCADTGGFSRWIPRRKPQDLVGSRKIPITDRPSEAEAPKIIHQNYRIGCSNRS